MPAPYKDYYKQLPARIGDVLTPEQYKEVEELGLLVDADDQVWLGVGVDLAQNRHARQSVPTDLQRQQVEAA